MNTINPFRPNYPINPGMFVGRLSELRRIERHLLQTSAGYPSNFMITGERGIGKTSLLNYLKAVAEGRLSIGEDKSRIRFLVIDIDIDQNTTQFGLIKKIELALHAELGKTEPARNFLKNAWAFLTRVEAAGFRLHPSSSFEHHETLVDEFSYSLAETVNRVCTGTNDEEISSARYDGVLILIDEADNASKSLALGSFIKLLTERLDRRGCQKVMIGLAGLPNLRNVLLSSHESSIRSLEECNLDRLSNDEVASVVDICLQQGTKENQVSYEITKEARLYLTALSEGFPHFIQQFGYCAFDVDSDRIIDQQDVMTGTLRPRGALDLLGDRYYRNDFYNKIQKESYRQVLRIMADRLDEWITKNHIRENFKGTDTTLNNALQALRERKIIFSKEGERGVYRLQNKGFALWIKLKTSDPGLIQRNLATEAMLEKS